MLDLHIEKSPNTPKIDFVSEEGIMSLEGRSIPENPADFYQPLFKWLQDYFKNPKSETQVVIKLEYINSGSSKSMLDFLRQLKEQHIKGNKCVIKWYYEEDDESVQELGRHYQHTLKLPFEFLSY
jgi:hypothetical protein